MPYVEYFQKRAKARAITGPDVVDLISSSTITHKKAAGGYVPLAHPPHPHAHISKEGFKHEPLSKQQLNDMRSLRNTRPLGPKGQARLQQYKYRQVANTEGLHLDPARHSRFMDPERQIVDPSKKGVPQPYIQRKVHSQFEDSEVAVMALVHSLNTPAAEAGLGWLTGPQQRISITSKTAANALQAGPVPYKNPPKALSAHPLRGAVPQVIQRGSGTAGNAPTPTAAIVGVVSVIDRLPNDELRLVTHYPIAAPVPVQDSVTFKDFNTGAKKTANFAAGAPAAPVEVTWSTPQPSIATSRSAGAPCVRCGTVHGRWTSSRFNPWYQCDRCGDVYCPVHGAALAAAPVVGNPNARACARSGCTGHTSYIY